ncbi:MAG TPA: ABC transporter substrate-binding protein [Acidimicrobiales bacterium]|nr:ABC transporter substrate-binding protein [Acidimicrobiales bacterium]
MCVIVLVACSSKTGNNATTTTQASSPTGGSRSSGTSGSSPGVTATSVTVGQVDDLSSPIPGLFKGAEDGTKAYFAYINNNGGVNGRRLILDAQDSTFQGGQVATATGTQIRNDFALVGGFSLLDSAEKPLIDLARVPDVGFSLSPGLSTDPYLYSPLPNPENYYPLNLFKYLKKTYPQAVKKVGIIWENATASTTAAETAVEAAMKAAGMQVVYDHGVGPFDTNFLPDIIAMKNKGVKMFFSTELPDNYAATLAKQFQQQNFKAINIEGAAYSAQLLKLAGSAANNMYIEQGYALYLGQDAKTVPAVGLFNKWMNKVDSKPNFEIEAVYGWASAMLFAQALQGAGNPPTRSGLVAALNKITFFDAGGLVPPSNPAGAIPSGCFLLAQVQNGKIKRVAPTPTTGFYCGSNSFLKEPGYTAMIRPTS